MLRMSIGCPSCLVRNTLIIFHARMAKANDRKSGMVLCRSLTTTTKFCHHQWSIMVGSSIRLPSFTNFTA
jgi:TPP-dependent indolepyruvate ferredoxin oxidoreductase alpha subunit